MANIAEFGITPLFTVDVFVGMGQVLYPLSAFWAMSAAALKYMKPWK